LIVILCFRKFASINAIETTPASSPLIARW
jgi:hypothetical protein